MKIDRLQLINASARYQLLSANQQLIDFHLGRIMQGKKKAKLQKDTDRHVKRLNSTLLKEKEQNLHLSQELGTQLKTIKEEHQHEEMDKTLVQ